jgi:hypothetical protein
MSWQNKRHLPDELSGTLPQSVERTRTEKVFVSRENVSLPSAYIYRCCLLRSQSARLETRAAGVQLKSS